MNIIQSINKFFQRINEDHVGEYAAKCAYFTFLSFIPFVLLLLSLIKYMNIDRSTLEYILEAFLPTVTKNGVVDIIQEMYSKSFQMISISAIFTLWSAANSFYALTLGLSSVYRSENKNNFILLRIKGVVGTIIIIVTIIMVLILLVFGNRISLTVEENFPNFSEIINFILSIRSLLVIISLFIIFVLMYRFVPDHQKGSSLKSQIPGATFASIGWFVLSYFFSIYIDIFTNFSVIYGSLTTIILIMMWLYAIIYMILIGAEINVMVAKRKTKLIDSAKIKTLTK